MSLDTLATMIAVCLALLTATTGAAVGTLFHHEAAVARDKAG
jgi:hypothetical protein